MSYLLSTLGNLTDLRNLNELEAGFTELVCQVAKAACAVLWRLEEGLGPMTLQKRVTLPEVGASLASEAPSLRDCALLQEEQKPLCRRAMPGGQGLRYFFPVSENHRVAALIDLLVAERLDPETARTVALLARLFGNHTGLLNYGERDELTGLRNRRGFNSEFKQLLGCGAGRTVIGVADIDHFKRINDEFGHLYGDEVLILMARLMRSAFREADGIFRFGGEEFVIVMRNTGLEGAAKGLEAFRAKVARTSFPQVGQVSVSIGFSAVRQFDDASAVFGRADEALYVAKQTGRNQVHCHEWLVREGVLAGAKKVGGGFELF